MGASAPSPFCRPDAGVEEEVRVTYANLIAQVVKQDGERACDIAEAALSAPLALFFLVGHQPGLRTGAKALNRNTSCFLAHFQHGDMDGNGKRVDRERRFTDDCATGPPSWRAWDQQAQDAPF
jgi:hypothetical protein